MTSGVPLFTMADLDAIVHQAHDVARVSAAGSRVERVVFGGRNRSSSVYGVMPAYFAIRSWGALTGRLYTEEDERQAGGVCVIGQTVVDDLFQGESPNGKELRVRDKTFRVVGVLEPKGISGGVDQDDTVFMPYSTFSRRLVGTDRTAAIIASAVSPDRIDEAKEEITGILRRRRHIAQGDDDNFAPRDLQAVLQSVMGMLTTLLAGVAAVSLVVGGIGIMNIMLVSVTERTREIGVRLAIGARSRDILTQFLVEATLLSALGGLVGVGLGLVAAWGAARAIHVPFVAPGTAMPVAFAVSVVVGVVFGVWPARKASRLRPLEALRFE
jgi:putative ABC transport system permease protein